MRLPRTSAPDNFNRSPGSSIAATARSVRYARRTSSESCARRSGIESLAPRSEDLNPFRRSIQESKRRTADFGSAPGCLMPSRNSRQEFRRPHESPRASQTFKSRSACPYSSIRSPKTDVKEKFYARILRDTARHGESWSCQAPRCGFQGCGAE